MLLIEDGGSYLLGKNLTRPGCGTSSANQELYSIHSCLHLNRHTSAAAGLSWQSNRLKWNRIEIYSTIHRAIDINLWPSTYISWEHNVERSFDLPCLGNIDRDSY